MGQRSEWRLVVASKRVCSYGKWISIYLCIFIIFQTDWSLRMFMRINREGFQNSYVEREREWIYKIDLVNSIGISSFKIVNVWFSFEIHFFQLIMHSFSSRCLDRIIAHQIKCEAHLLSLEEREWQLLFRLLLHGQESISLLKVLLCLSFFDFGCNWKVKLKWLSSFTITLLSSFRLLLFRSKHISKEVHWIH